MITLRKVSETTTTITLGWDRVPGAVGYRFTVDGKVSHTFDPTRDTVKVSKAADHTLVEALGVLDSGVWPTVPPPSNVLYDGRFDTGNFSRWRNHEMLSSAMVVDTPHGKVMRARTSGSVSMVNVGQNFEDYQLPWEIIPADVWHRFGILLPSGNNPAYPGRFVKSVIGSHWDMFWELHDRTDPASGYVQGQTPGSYGSTMVTVQGTDSDLRWQIRMAGNTLPNPVNTFFSLPDVVQRDRWYIHDVRVKHGQTAASGGFAEWWLDGVKRWEQACPTAFVCADGKSGERLQAGIYRGGFSGDTNVYLDGVVVTSARQA